MEKSQIKNQMLALENGSMDRSFAAFAEELDSLSGTHV